MPDYTYDDGDTRYFYEIATLTSTGTTTAATVSASYTSHGANLHSLQLNVTLPTTTGQMVASLQGCLEATPTNWANLATLTFTASKTEILSANVAVRDLRVRIDSATTVGGTYIMNGVLFGAYQ